MYKYHDIDDLKCSCCGQCAMNEHSMELFEVLLSTLSFRPRVNSAYRCENHPIEKGKPHPGVHTLGVAIDYGCFGKQADELMRKGRELGLHGCGVKQHGPHLKRFVHLDNAEAADHRPRPWIWSYS